MFFFLDSFGVGWCFFCVFFGRLRAVGEEEVHLFLRGVRLEIRAFCSFLCSF